jgi:hypothetical protein
MPIYNHLPFPLCNLPLPTLAPVDDEDLMDGLHPLLAGLTAFLLCLQECHRGFLTHTELSAALQLLAGQAALCVQILEHWSAGHAPRRPGPPTMPGATPGTQGDPNEY